MINRKITKKILYSVATGIVLRFFINSILKNYDAIVNFDVKFNFIYITIGIILALFVVYHRGLLRISFFKKEKIPLFDGLYIHSISWLAKYIPGKVGIVASKITMVQKFGISKRSGAIMSFYENIFQILCSFLVSIPFLIGSLFGKTENLNIFLMLLFVFVLGLILHPKIFGLSINLVLRLIKRKTIETGDLLTGKEIFKYLLLYSIGLVVNGLGFYFIILGITDLDFKYILTISAIRNISGVIGLLAVFTPAGVGVREGLLVLLLQNYISLEAATIISVLSRGRTTLVDCLVGLYIIGYNVYIRKSS